MLETPWPSLRRLALGLALVVVALVQIDALVQTIHSQARERERVVREERRTIIAAAPGISQALEAGNPDLARQALREVLALAGASEIEVRELGGKPVFAYPAAAPVPHWPSARELTGLGGGSVLTVGPIGREPGRLFTYLVVRSAGDPRLLRIARESPELLASLREGQRLLMTHGAALVVLVLALALVLLKGHEGRGSSPRALRAYEEAMDRLAARGQELVRQHQAERQVLEAHIEDQDAMARAGELTAGIVHEVRNGLATVLGHAKLLEAQSQAAESARAIREECETLERVIRRFMEFIKREHLNLAPVSLGRLLGRLAARECRSRPGAVVSADMAAGQDDALAGDEALLERAFENLIRNARDAAGPDGRVAVTLETDAEQRRVRIADDGPGLAPQLRAGPRPFLTTKPGGLGLGLAIALKIVRLHGGSLQLTDNQPRGLIVTVSLPASGPATDRVVTRSSTGDDRPPHALRGSGGSSG